MIVARNIRGTTRTLRRAGFTLMEVMVVAAILVILAGVGSFAIFGYLESAKEKAATTTIHKIETAVMNYKIDHHEFPPNLQVLTVPEGTKPATLETSDLADPWGNAYVYEPQNVNQTGHPRISVAAPPSGNPISNW
jgi:general secretion pathway protein G